MLMVIYVNGDNGSASYDETYFENFGVEHIPKEFKNSRTQNNHN